MQKLPSGWIRSFPEESQVPSSADYPTAGAIYLLDEDIFYLKEKIEVRVVIMKIFNRRGYRYAEVTTPYYRKDESMEVRGRTKRKDGTVMELKKEDIHSIWVSNDLKRKKFSLPAIEDNCVIHYEIIYRSKKYPLSGIRYFQNEEPTILSRFSLIVPPHLQVIYSDSPTGILDTIQQAGGYAGKTALYTFAKTNLLPREEEPFMPPRFDSSPCLAFSITALDKRKELQASWDNVSRWYFETIESHFIPTASMKKLAKRLTQKCQGEMEKVKRIFYFVQSHFKADFTSRSIFDRAQTIFNRQVGSSAEIGGTLYALLKASGIEATFVLVPDREMVMKLPEVPMLDWFSHLLLKVNIGEEQLWMDPSNQTNGLNCISWRYQGVDGLLVQEEGGKPIQVPLVNYSENRKESLVHIKVKPRGRIECDARELYSLQGSSEIKNLLRKKTFMERKNYLAKRICQGCPGAILDSCNFGDLYSYEEDFKIHYGFHSDHYVQKDNDRLYINPNILNRDETAKEFSEPSRIFPIMFDQVKTDMDHVTIDIPSAYEIVSLPEPIHLVNDFGEFKTEYKIDNNSVIYRRRLIIKKLMVPASSYKEIKSFFNRIFEEDQKVLIIQSK